MQIENPLTASPLAFPILECFHIIGFIVGLGSAALVDLQALGFGFPRRRPEQLQRETTYWTMGGLTVSIFAGILLFSTDPDKYYLNKWFLVKVACLVLAIVFRFALRRKLTERDVSSFRLMALAIVSLCLWLS